MATVLDIKDPETRKLLGMPSLEHEAAINAKALETITTLREALAALPSAAKLAPPVFVYDLKGRVAGMACSNPQAHPEYYVRINVDLLYKYPDRMINQTVPHEVCHIVESQLGGKMGHGSLWQTLMQFLGLPADRTHSYEVTKARIVPRIYVYSCVCGEPHTLTEIRHNRVVKGQKYLCTSCNQEIKFQGIKTEV